MKNWSGPISPPASYLGLTITNLLIDSRRSIEDTIITALHVVVSHLEQQRSYARLLFVDFNTAFNTIIHSRLVTKLSESGGVPLHLPVDPGLPDRPLPTSPQPSGLVPALLRAVCLACCSTPSIPMIAPRRIPASASSSLLMTPLWWNESPMGMRLPTKTR